MGKKSKKRKRSPWPERETPPSSTGVEDPQGKKRKEREPRPSSVVAGAADGWENSVTTRAMSSSSFVPDGQEGQEGAEEHNPLLLTEDEVHQLWQLLRDVGRRIYSEHCSWEMDFGPRQIRGEFYCAVYAICTHISDLQREAAAEENIED